MEQTTPDTTPTGIQIIDGGNMLEQVNRAEIDIQITTAHAYPRQPEKCESKMVAMVCRDDQVAIDCIYVLPRGNKRIEGPSIRLAEIIAVNWGNMRVVTRPPVVGRTTVSVEWAAHDLESNYATSGTVSAPILYGGDGPRAGTRYNDDMINVTALATTAKARRNGIIAIVPGTIVKALVAQARQIITGGDRPIEARRELAMSYYRKMGIADDRILAAVDRTAIEQVTDDDLVALHGLANSIKDGQTTIDLSFPPIVDKPTASRNATAALADKLKGGKSGKGKSGKPKAKPADDAKDGGTDSKTPEPRDANLIPGELLPWEECVIMLADKCGCEPKAAASKLSVCVPKLYQGTTLQDLDESQIDDLTDKIASGAITVTV